ncbi:MAG: hypothetical protein HC836_46930, partial [Richelia sp. RM2_1_2]|nr:hypothetical protein [Richelia sp. RM2_1_2]
MGKPRIKTCVDCNTTESYRWYAGPQCEKCRYEAKASAMICVKCSSNWSKRWYKGPTCQLCYNKDYLNNKNNYTVCGDCGSKTKNSTYKNKCSACYKRNYRKNSLKPWESDISTRKQNKNKNKTLRGKYLLSKNRAEKRGLAFDIDFQNFEDLLKSGCSYCSEQLVDKTGCSLDRIDNNKGYLKDNVLPCCGRCN